MGIFRNYKILLSLVLIISVLCCFSPVLADNATVMITYRGAGGNYIGDTILFDGINSVSNTTLLKVTGPGLPSEGVPVYDLNGPAGAGNPVEVNPDGTWRFAWYTGTIQGVDKMQTARYYITAYDLTNPSISSITSIMMEKPEFYVVPTPNPVETGDYIQLLGTAVGGAPDIRIEIQNQSGSILHVYDTSASTTGYFNYGFHIDMQPGDYPVIISSPTMINSYRTIIHVVPPPTSVPTAGETSSTGISPGSTFAITPGITTTPAVSGVPVTQTAVSTQNPGPSAVSPLAIIAGLIVAGLVIVLILLLGKKI